MRPQPPQHRNSQRRNQPAAQQPVAQKVLPPGHVAIDTSKGYARMLFSFSAPSSVSASIASGVLTIRLAQAIDSSTDTLTRSLGRYVTSGRADADGKTLRFALADPAALHSSTVGGADRDRSRSRWLRRLAARFAATSAAGEDRARFDEASTPSKRTSRNIRTTHA